MVFKKLSELNKLKKENEKLRAENDLLKEAQKRCTECELFDKRRGFPKETEVKN